MPRSQPPVESCTLAMSRPGLLPSQGMHVVGFSPRDLLKGYPLSTTIPISELHHAARTLAPSSFVRPWLGVHVEVTPDLLARRSSGRT
jgi:hypothetical protein